MATTTLKRNAKVHAMKDLLGVPRGTRGKVLLIGGVSWKRYWVDFENGVSMPGVDRAEVGTKEEWVRAKDGTYVEPVADDGAAAAATDDGPVGEPIEGVPFHLVERSRAARARMGG